jgi:hypothetical protein
MRRILALAMLALMLAGGVMTFIASHEAQATKIHATHCDTDTDGDKGDPGVGGC